MKLFTYNEKGELVEITKFDKIKKSTKKQKKEGIAYTGTVHTKSIN